MSSGLSIEQIEGALVDVWERTLGRSPIGRDDDFHALGMNSLAAELLIRVEQRFGRRLPFSTYFSGGNTVAGMARALLDSEEPAQWRPRPALVALQPRGSRPAICWLPGGSGMSATSVRTLSLLLGPDQPVYGLETALCRDGPFDVRSRATAYVESLRAALPPPYSLFGYSYGAWTALEMARQFRASGTQVRRLVVFDEEVPRRWTPRERALKVAQHIRWHLRRVRIEPWNEVVRIGRGLRRRFRKIAGQATDETGFPPGSIYDVVDRAVRAGIVAYSLEPQPPWPGAITLVIGDRVEGPGRGGELDLRMGWRRIAGGGLRVIRVPSDHLSMLEGAEAEHLAIHLRQLLDDDF